ncbi:hypothetical protein HHI36_015704 [Cryptolaemus montrouzieri]|uniref:Uncharacterized protein n=1 Tax=Cryptolaemus montrouzieri TaxID=559131 RepID=A0ABD2N6T1_9CUCU
MGIRTEIWKVIGEKRESKGVTVVLAKDEDSLDTLKAIKDLTTIRMKIKEGDELEEVIKASAYSPLESLEPTPDEVAGLVIYCRRNNLQILIEADENSPSHGVRQH